MSDLQQCKLDLTDYFNLSLKKYLGYTENFNIEFYHNRIILKPNIKSILLENITNDTNLKTNLLNIISYRLKKTFPNLHDLAFYTNGTNISIKFNTVQSKLLEQIPPKGFVGVYSNIAYNLNGEDLDNFCRSTS